MTKPKSEREKARARQMRQWLAEQKRAGQAVVKAAENVDKAGARLRQAMGEFIATGYKESAARGMFTLSKTCRAALAVKEEPETRQDPQQDPR